jgi:perosamine synthetase
MTALAINGGTPVRSRPFPPSVTTSEEEIDAVTQVLRTGLLSGFVGSPSPEFFGGPTVRRLESKWSEKFRIKHSVSCNSATSALMMAVGAAGIGPGDEVIVSPYTMSATATSILIYGGIPVFGDIEPDCFCLDSAKLEAKITSRTRAILTTDIHGQPSAMREIQQIARKHNLLIITDTAQAPGALYGNRYAGTIGDIGVFSLNRHKNIQSGEGGIACTDNDELALRMQLIRNHGENLVDKPGFEPKSLVNMLGFNFRMTELEAAVATEQLKKLDHLNTHRVDLAAYLNRRLRDNPLVTVPRVREGCTHVYYMYAMTFRNEAAACTREEFVAAIRAEGIPIWGGYLKPLYLEPLYQKQIAIGDQGFPFVGPHVSNPPDYRAGLCPVAEDLFENKTIINPFLYPPLDESDVRDIADAIEKVTEALS